jgi:tight adherence protein B
VGNGRQAFQSATGQTLTLFAVLLVVGCWLWAGRILRVPEEERVFDR